MNVGTSFVTDDEATESGDPCEDSFDDPTMPAEILATFDTPAGDTVSDTVLRAGGAASAGSRILRRHGALRDDVSGDRIYSGLNVPCSP